MKALKYRNNSLNKANDPMVEKVFRQYCINAVKETEAMSDVCYLYALVDTLHFGKKRCRRLYQRYWELRDEIQKEVLAEGNDGTCEMYMRNVLKARGIDVEALYKEFAKERYDIEINDGLSK